MTYPYGTKGAPVVGNGLGGLPRRAVAEAVAAETSYPKTLVPVGDPLLINTNSFSIDPALARGGMIGDSIAVINYTLNNGSNNVQHLAAISVGPSGASLIGTASTGVTDNAYGIGIEENSYFSSGSQIFWVRANALRRATVTGSSITYAEVTTALIPATGTLTIGGLSYTQVVIPKSPDLKQYDGSNERVYDMGDGTGIVFRFCNISGFFRPCAFLINGSGTILKSMAVGGALHSSLSSSNFITLFKTGATQLSIYSVGFLSPNWYTSAANFDISAGTSTVFSTGSTSSPGSSNISSSLTQLASPGFLRMYWLTTGPSTSYISFKINNDYTPISDTVQGGSLEEPKLNWSAYKVWSTRYSDYQTTLLNNPSNVGPIDKFSYPTAPSMQYVTDITWDTNTVFLPSIVDGTTYPVSNRRTKTICSGAFETNSGAYGLPYTGPFFINRISSDLFLMYLYDQFNSAHRSYVQVYRAV